MVATATKILLPNSTVTNDSSAYSTVGSASTLHEAADPGATLAHDDDSTYVARGGGGTPQEKFGFDVDTTFPEKMAHVISVKVHTRHRLTASSDTIKLSVVLNATTVTATNIPISASYTSRDSGSLARPGGGDWTEEDFRDSSFEFQWNCDTSPANPQRITSLWVEVEYIPLNRTIDLEREIASRRLRLNREPEEIVQIVNGWEALEAELMDPVGFSHAHGPTPDAQGWGVKDWQRGFGRLKKQQISLSMPKVKSVIGNRRRYQTTLWETMKLVVSGDQDVADGMARLDAAGADREFTRASKAWVEDAGGVIKQINEAKEKIEPMGILIEEARTNYVLESSFVNGTTGWSKTENTGTADFAADTSNLLFDSGVSAQSGSLTATAATHDVEITDSTASLDASTEHTLSVDGEISLASGTIDIFLQNDTTGNWLTASNTWQGSRPATAPISFSPTTKTRTAFTFDTESTASAHTIVWNGNGTVDGTVYNFFHAQIEQGAWKSSRIVCSGSSVTRADDNLLIQNASSLAQRIFPVDKFTVEVLFTPQWNSADISGTATIFELYHDANNGIRVEHTSAPALQFVYEHGGTSETASLASPGLVADTEYKIVIRKGSTSGELGEANNTMSIFLDGTKGGTTDTASSNITEASASVFQIGSLNDVTQHVNGWFGGIMVSPIVFSDTEISGGLP